MDLPLNEKYTAKNALIAAKIAGEMTKVKLAELYETRTTMEIEQHRAVIRNSSARIRNVEHKSFDELPVNTYRKIGKLAHWWPKNIGTPQK